MSRKARRTERVEAAPDASTARCVYLHLDNLAAGVDRGASSRQRLQVAGDRKQLRLVVVFIHRFLVLI